MHLPWFFSNFFRRRGGGARLNSLGSIYLTLEGRYITLAVAELGTGGGRGGSRRGEGRC